MSNKNYKGLVERKLRELADSEDYRRARRIFRADSKSSRDRLRSSALRVSRIPEKP